MTHWREIGAIFAGGGLGTLARAALAQGFPHAATAWPWPTFGVNVVAALVLGYVVTSGPAGYRRPLLATGLCGGLSTFSAMQAEIVNMLDGRAWALAAGYAAASVAAGYAAVRLGIALARRARSANPESGAAGKMPGRRGRGPGGRPWGC